jgi:hypothetical protein
MAKAWAAGLLASLAGLVVSASFLSLTDHNVLWIFIGLAAALGAAASRQGGPVPPPGFSWRDLAVAGVVVASIAGATMVYTRIAE